MFQESSHSWSALRLMNMFGIHLVSESTLRSPLIVMHLEQSLHLVLEWI